MKNKKPVQAITWNRLDGCFSSDDVKLVEEAIDDLDYDITIENDGIGYYEFWGAPGHDYAVLESDDEVYFEIKNGVSHPETAVQDLLDDLVDSWTGRKSVPKKHARCEEDCVDFEVDIHLHHEVIFKDGKLLLKLWIEGE
jgi:hypothetical protein